MGNAPENKGVFVKKGNYRINGGLLKSRFQHKARLNFTVAKSQGLEILEPRLAVAPS